MSCQRVQPQQVLCLATLSSALSISYHQRTVPALTSAMRPVFPAAGPSQSQRGAYHSWLALRRFCMLTQTWTMCGGHMEAPSDGGDHGGQSLASAAQCCVCMCQDIAT